MELRALRYFDAVATEGSFVRAAERLHIVQPAVSQQIQRLERELGVQLFDRSTRAIRLTASGARLLEEARATLLAADRVQQVAADIAAGVVGGLAIGTTSGLGRYLTDVLAELDRTTPGVHVRLASMRVEARMDAVRDGSLDAAFVRAVVAPEGLALVPVSSECLIAAVPSSLELAAQVNVRVADLAELPVRLGVREINPPFHDLVVGAVSTVGAVKYAEASFTTLQNTLTEIPLGAPSWAPLYGSPDELPTVPGVAYLSVSDIEVTTSLVTRERTNDPALSQLLQALRTVAPARRGDAATFLAEPS